MDSEQGPGTLGGALRSANLLKVWLVTTAAILAICLLALAETTNTAQAASPLKVITDTQNGKIAFASNQGSKVGQMENYDIYTAEPDGTNLRRLTNSPHWEERPVWSPDGTQIAYSHLQQLTSEEAISDVYVMNADGSGKTNRTRNQGDGTSPAWSPDGTSIAFSSIRDSGDVFAQDTISDIYTMDADGSDVVRVTKTPLEVSETQPDWQPLTP